MWSLLLETEWIKCKQHLSLLIIWHAKYIQKDQCGGNHFTEFPDVSGPLFLVAALYIHQYYSLLGTDMLSDRCARQLKHFQNERHLALQSHCHMHRPQNKCSFEQLKHQISRQNRWSAVCCVMMGLRLLRGQTRHCRGRCPMKSTTKTRRTGLPPAQLHHSPLSWQSMDFSALHWH